MALGPYNHPGLIGEAALDSLLAQYNTLLTTPFGTSVTESINSALFPLGGKIPYQSDSSTGGNVTLAQNTHVFLEYGNSTSPIDFNTNGASALIVLGATNALTFNDLGSTGDSGDTIVGTDGANQKIEVQQGANLVIGGSGFDTLIAGSTATSDDSLYGGGHTSMYGASAGTVHMRGGFNPDSADTLVGGSGNDYMKVKYGNNVIIAGSGHDTITSLDRGNNGAGGDMISLTAGGSAMVYVGNANAVGTATDTVTFGGTKGDDTIEAHGAVVIDIVGETLTGITVTSSGTTLSFQDGQQLVYSGNDVKLSFH